LRTKFESAVADALDVLPEDVRIQDVSAGSVVVTFSVEAAEEDVDAVAATLVEQDAEIIVAVEQATDLEASGLEVLLDNEGGEGDDEDEEDDEGEEDEAEEVDDLEPEANGGVGSASSSRTQSESKSHNDVWFTETAGTSKVGVVSAAVACSLFVCLVGVGALLARRGLCSSNAACAPTRAGSDVRDLETGPQSSSKSPSTPTVIKPRISTVLVQPSVHEPACVGDDDGTVVPVAALAVPAYPALAVGGTVVAVARPAASNIP